MDFSMFESKYIVMVYCIIATYTNMYGNTVEASNIEVAADRIKNYGVSIDPKDISKSWKTSTYTLTGFGVNDSTEVMRILLTYLNVEFDYIKLNEEKLEDRTLFKAQTYTGRTTFLEIDRKVLFDQPIAACRYLANLAGLNGKNSQEKCVIDTYIGHIVEWHNKVFSYHYETDKTSRETKHSELIAKTLPTYLGLFDDKIRENQTGYIIGDELSWVDLAFVNTLNFVKMSTNYEVNSQNYDALIKHSERISTSVRYLDERKAFKEKKVNSIKEDYVLDDEEE